MSTEIRIDQLDPKLKEEFFDFAKLVHPKEKGLRERLEWFTFRNPLRPSDKALPGLAIATSENEVIGQFLMSPFEFQVRQKKITGYFGYDFFMKEEYRSRGAGALLFVQGVRMYKPFIGVGLTHVVEKISKAAGIQTIGILKKFIWVKNPVSFGGQLLKQRWIKSPEEGKKIPMDGDFPDVVDVAGLKFQHRSSMPEGLDLVCPDEVLEPVRSADFLRWRFLESPWQYHVYVNRDQGAPLFLVVRKAMYQGMKLLLVVDYRFPPGQWKSLDTILSAAKAIAADTRLDGVVMSSTYAKVEEALMRERFMAAGKPSSVIAYLPNDEFSPAVTSIFLTMADADLDFSFGEDP